MIERPQDRRCEDVQDSPQIIVQPIGYRNEQRTNATIQRRTPHSIC